MKSTHIRTSEIPDRVYFRIGEVSSLVGVDTHVLRYWESEFKVIKPRRAKSKQRLYRKKDVENLLLIRTLLHDEGYTIAGARRLLKAPGRLRKKVPVVETTEVSTPSSKSQLHIIKQELEEILDKLVSSKLSV
ncbi:MAG: MerR family transcriptional regulator [Desulfobulbus sp.]|nr:MAG: MerR family transcriptional regulator [Desulfobulbus sp.]